MQCSEPAPNYKLTAPLNTHTASLRKVREAQFQNRWQRKAKALRCLLSEHMVRKRRNFSWPTPGADGAHLRLRHNHDIFVRMSWLLVARFINLMAGYTLGFPALKVWCAMHRAFEPAHATRTVAPIRRALALAMSALNVAPWVPQLIMPAACLQPCCFGPKAAGRTS